MAAAADASPAWTCHSCKQQFCETCESGVCDSCVCRVCTPDAVDMKDGVLFCGRCARRSHTDVVHHHVHYACIARQITALLHGVVVDRATWEKDWERADAEYGHGVLMFTVLPHPLSDVVAPAGAVSMDYAHSPEIRDSLPSGYRPDREMLISVRVFDPILQISTGARQIVRRTQVSIRAPIPKM
jgi:hypothetical protein